MRYQDLVIKQMGICVVLNVETYVPGRELL